MIACFCDAGKQPSRNEALTIAVTYGSSGSNVSFSRNVGIGSSVQDFVGDAMMVRRTSSSEQTINSVIDDLTVRNDVGGRQSAVLAQTDFTFSAKNLMKSSAVYWLELSPRSMDRRAVRSFCGSFVVVATHCRHHHHHHHLSLL